MDGNKIRLRSIIKTYFSDETYIEMYKVLLNYKISNNEKISWMCDIMTEAGIPYSMLGPGTNRFAVLIEDYAVKIALDNDGCIDNKREMLYSRDLYPYAIKVYECAKNGFLAVSEFVTLFNLDDFTKNKSKMKEILGELAKFYLIGDVGVTTKNYVNWGTRSDGSICMLDFAYCYDVKSSIFACTCDGRTMLKYDSDFVTMSCPKCGKKYTFPMIQDRVDMATQKKEIGDILRLGYNLRSATEIQNRIDKFEPVNKTLAKKKKKEAEKEKWTEIWRLKEEYESHGNMYD